MPEQVFYALHLFEHRSTIWCPFCLQRLGLLLENREPHRDMKPVDRMFAVGVQVLLDPPHVFAPIGHKHDLLVFLHPLGFHQLP